MPDVSVLKNHTFLIAAMKTYETDAIILRTIDYGESDRLIIFLTRLTGKIKGIAKGARKSRKRFVHSLEPYSLVSLRYKERKSFMWIESCELLEPNLALRADLERWAHAALISEVIDKMVPENESHEQLFELCTVSLAQLTVDNDPLNVVVLFLLRFMDNSGYLPYFTKCNVCNRDLDGCRRWWWVLGEGKLLCSDHIPENDALTIPVDLGTVLLIQRARTIPLNKLWRLRVRQAQKQELAQTLCRWVMGQSNKRLKTLNVLQQCRQDQSLTGGAPACEGTGA